MTKISRPKPKQKENYCIYCNKLVDNDKDEFVLSKRHTLIYFHSDCFKIYGRLGLQSWIE